MPCDKQNKFVLFEFYFMRSLLLLFEAVSPLLSDLLEMWMTFMYQNAYIPHLFKTFMDQSALDASSNISKKEEEKTLIKINHILLAMLKVTHYELFFFISMHTIFLFTSLIILYKISSFHFF